MHSVASNPMDKDGKITRWICGTFFFLLPAIAYLSYKALVPLIMTTSLALLWAVGPRRTFLRLATGRVPLIAIGAFALWVLASSVWSVQPATALGESLRFLFLLGCSVALIASTLEINAQWIPRELDRWVIAGLGFAIVLAWLVPYLPSAYTEWNLTSDGDNRVHGPFYTAVAMLMFPLIYGLVRKRQTLSAAAAAILCCVILLYSEVEAGPLAFGAGGIAFAITIWNRHITLAIAAIALVLYSVMVLWGCMEDSTVFAQLLAKIGQSGTNADISLIHRLYMYDFVNSAACRAPWFGFGHEAARTLPGADSLIPGIGRVYVSSHPHNAMLQVWVELGVVGLALYVASILACLWWATANLDQWACATVVAVLTVFLVVQQISYNFWASWWWATGGLAIALSTMRWRDQI